MRRGRGAPFGRSFEADRRARRPGSRCPACIAPVRGAPARVAPVRRVGEALRPGAWASHEAPFLPDGALPRRCGRAPCVRFTFGNIFSFGVRYRSPLPAESCGFLECVQVMLGDAREEVPKTGMNLASRGFLEPEGFARSLFDPLPHGEAPDRRLLEHLTGTGKGINEYGQVKGGKVLLR